jgi:hypothetical protein
VHERGEGINAGCTGWKGKGGGSVHVCLDRAGSSEEPVLALDRARVVQNGGWRTQSSLKRIEGVAAAVAVGHRTLDVVREPVHEVSGMPSVPAGLAPRVPILELAPALGPVHCRTHASAVSD